MRDEVLPAVLAVDAMAGAEWWLQDTDCEDAPKEFHVDADVQVGSVAMMQQPYYHVTYALVNRWPSTAVNAFICCSEEWRHHIHQCVTPTKHRRPRDTAESHLQTLKLLRLLLPPPLRGEQITDGESTHSLPCMSSVFYLDSVGGPTVACGQTKTPEGELEPRLPRDLAVVFPQENQLMTFRGDLYHAGMSAHPSARCSPPDPPPPPPCSLLSPTLVPHSRSS